MTKDQFILIDNLRDELEILNQTEKTRKDQNVIIYRILTGNFTEPIENLDLLAKIYAATAVFYGSTVRLMLGINIVAEKKF